MSYFGTIYTEELPHRAKAIYMYRQGTGQTGAASAGRESIRLLPTSAYLAARSNVRSVI